MLQSKRFFETCQALDGRVDAKLDEIEQAKSLAIRATALCAREPRSTAQDDLLRAPLERIEALAADIADELACLIYRRGLMRRVIAAVGDEKRRNVLEWRHQSRWGWNRIAATLCCERMQAWRVYGQALADVQVVLDEMAASGMLKPHLETAGLIELCKEL